jgi:unsaturated rhamnogalacturonyl hydrolase
MCCFTAHAQVVTLDCYFNREVHKDSSGKMVRFHYMWNDTAKTGFSTFGDILQKNGATLNFLEQAPTISNLKGSDIYIIVDPDTKEENTKPNYIESGDIKSIVEWVKKGGILLMLANDSANVELPHFNNLAEQFGMHFNNDLVNHVIDDNHLDDGAINTMSNPIFKTARQIFMKDVCSISIKIPARSFLRNKQGYVVIAFEKFGKGSVLTVGDPWLYNEYLNGRLPKIFENDKAATDIVKWLIAQIPPRTN